MKISFVEIQNFRKLKACRIELGDKETVFVGANNSGKTSAMDALILFLKKERRHELATTDFTLSHWREINAIGQKWLDTSEDEKLDFDIKQWHSLVPTVDIWLNVRTTEIHYVSHLIPTLSWDGGLLGVRLSFEPKDIENLYKEFIKSYTAASETKKGTSTPLKLWPNSLSDFLERRLNIHFGIKAYLLDPALVIEPDEGIAKLQTLADNATPLGEEPFTGLFKIDIINAQRGFTDAKSSDTLSSGSGATTLSAQLRAYYDKHLNPSEMPAPEDIDALIALENARGIFDERLKNSFRMAISELEGLGYPGFSDPRITLTSALRMQDGLNHESAVQFNVLGNNGGSEPVSLPEKYNGLGYQNLVSMVFKLIRFRDEWMKVGKADKKVTYNESITEPLHLVLIEEPEAHLHAQVQQVFINKAYDVLRNHQNLKDQDKLSTQMIISTHSSHIAHETDFSCLRYFRRRPAVGKQDVPNSTVLNLSRIFGEENDTSRFTTRYLKTTHCDLFFADAAILVEGPAERMLIPHFIKNSYRLLDSRYITILEIGGSHAHRLKPLIEELGLITLVITDIDSIKGDSIGKTQPKREASYRTGNSVLKEWLPKEENLMKLLNLDDEKKVSKNKLIRVAYQYPFKVNYSENEKEVEIIPYTFEDALVFSNIPMFRKMKSSTGLIKKMYTALKEDNATMAATKMFEALENGKKAEMALELLFLEENFTIVPKYIAEGLEWLQSQLKDKDQDYLSIDDTEGSM